LVIRSVHEHKHTSDSRLSKFCTCA